MMGIKEISNNITFVYNLYYCKFTNILMIDMKHFFITVFFIFWFSASW